ncbi:MAG: alginate export family protein [Bryobacteraceae bacterium]
MRTLAAIALAALTVAGQLGAADDSGTPAAVDTGTAILDSSPFENLPPWIQIGGQIRGRFEGVSGTSIINNSPDNYYASRLRIELGFKPTSWLRFFAQGQDTRVGAYNKSPAPSTLYDPLDLRQGYVELNFEGKTSVRFRAGRQEMAFGAERLIGPADWGISRTFDALDLTLSAGRAKVDLIAGSAVLIDPTRFDPHKPGEHLYGAYGSLRRVLPGVNIEPYLLFKQTLNVKSETGALGDALVISPGARVFGTAPGRIDYTVEVVAQRGSYSSDKVRALGDSAVAGWTLFDVAVKPRLSVEYNYASGDATAKDGERNTFDQFYPSNHSYYGMIDQFGWKNMKNARAGFDFLPLKKLKVRTDFNEFYLATIQDGLYNSSGTAVVLDRKATSSHIGSETNTVGLYQYSKVWKFGAGFGHLFAGEYLKESKVGFGYTYPYVMLLGNF